MRPHAGILPTDHDHGPLVLREEDAEHVDTLVGLVVRRRCPMAAHSEGRQLTTACSRRPLTRPRLMPSVIQTENLILWVSRSARWWLSSR